MSVTAEWVPSVGSGLSGAAYITEEIDPFIDEFDEIKQPGVYILRLSRPETDDLTYHKQLWKESHDKMAPYLDEIAHSPGGILYVGGAEQVLSRLEDHLDEKTNKSATIMDTYPPHSIVGIQFFETKQIAFDREKEIALRLSNRHSDMYIHCR